MMAYNGDDEMGTTGDGDGTSHWNEHDEVAGTWQRTTRDDNNTLESTASGSCRDYHLIPDASISNQIVCPEQSSECSSSDRSSMAMSSLHTYFLHLFKEKCIKNPRQDVRLIVDYGMIDIYQDKGAMAASHSNEIIGDVSQNENPSATSRVGGWWGKEETLETIAEEGGTYGIAVSAVDSSNDQDSLWHESYRSVDMLIKDEAQTRNHESPTSIVDMLGWDDIQMEKDDPRSLLLSVQPPHSSLSTTMSDNG
jgi:hypothetical protein